MDDLAVLEAVLFALQYAFFRPGPAATAVPEPGARIPRHFSGAGPIARREQPREHNRRTAVPHHRLPPSGDRFRQPLRGDDVAIRPGRAEARPRSGTLQGAPGAR